MVRESEARAEHTQAQAAQEARERISEAEAAEAAVTQAHERMREDEALAQNERDRAAAATHDAVPRSAFLRLRGLAAAQLCGRAHRRRRRAVLQAWRAAVAARGGGEEEARHRHGHRQGTEKGGESRASGRHGVTPPSLGRAVGSRQRRRGGAMMMDDAHGASDALRHRGNGDGGRQTHQRRRRRRRLSDEFDRPSASTPDVAAAPHAGGGRPFKPGRAAEVLGMHSAAAANRRPRRRREGGGSGGGGGGLSQRKRRGGEQERLPPRSDQRSARSAGVFSQSPAGGPLGVCVLDMAVAHAPALAAMIMIG
jgi:hypothetical protein